MVESLPAHGEPALLGITVRPIRLRVEEQETVGLLIVDIQPGGAAEQAALLRGDVLVGAQGQRFASVDDLPAILQAADAVVRIRFVRGDTRRVRETFVRLPSRKAVAA
jgi:S1-C subfamily serine protease